MHFSLPLFLYWSVSSDGGLLQLEALLVGFGQELSGELIQIFIDLLQGLHLLLQFRHSNLSVLPITKHTLTENRATLIITSLFDKQSSNTFNWWIFMTFTWPFQSFTITHTNSHRLFSSNYWARYSLVCEAQTSELIDLNKHIFVQMSPIILSIDKNEKTTDISTAYIILYYFCDWSNHSSLLY